MNKKIIGIVAVVTIIVCLNSYTSIFDDIGGAFESAWGEVVRTGEKVVRATKYAGHFAANGLLIAVDTIRGRPIDLSRLIYSEEQTVFFQEMPDGVPYWAGAELGSHNSFSNLQDGWIVFDQVWNIQNQLQRGVRHLLIDFHYLDSEQNRIYLCHGDCSISGYLKPGASFETAEHMFAKLKYFLDANPKAIVSIDAENYTSTKALVNALKRSGLFTYLLTPQIVNGNSQPMLTNNPDHIYWPTYGQLRSWNKRLIIFDDMENRSAGSAEYFFSTKKTLIRNQFGTIDINLASEKRGKEDFETEHDISRLLQLNYFESLTTGLMNQFIISTNTEANIMGVYAKLIQKGYIYPLRPIKYIVLQYVNDNINEVMSMINKLNAAYTKQYLGAH